MASNTAVKLESYIKEANFDDALRLVSDLPDPRVALHEAKDEFERLSLTCMIVDVLDYGGKYDKASELIEDCAKKAQKHLSAFLNDRIPATFQLQEDIVRQYKQECWAVMHLGMSLYRKYQYDKALRLFEEAKRFLEDLHNKGWVYKGSLSRAWYCIGLCYRQTHRNSEAKHAFAKAVEYGWYGMMARAGQKRPLAPYDYNIAKCFGLGIGWIKYSEASLAEAQADLIAARRLLLWKRVRFIEDYVRAIYACVLMAANQDGKTIEEAIRLLKKSYDSLTLADRPGHDPTEEHTPYAMRAANDLARAYYYRALAEPPGSSREKHFEEAGDFLRRVKLWAFQAKDWRTYCQALINQSRMCREKGNRKEALSLAREALKYGGNSEFSRIDCLIAKGEAEFSLGRGHYPAAVGAFTQALQFGKTNPKVFAVCHLHLVEVNLAACNPLLAIEHYRAWEQTGLTTESGFVRRLRERVSEQISILGSPFLIKHEDTDLTAREHLNRLRGWLTDVAIGRSQHGRYADAAELLGIGIGAFVNWRKAAGLPIHPNQRTKRSRGPRKVA